MSAPRLLPVLRRFFVAVPLGGPGIDLVEESGKVVGGAGRATVLVVNVSLLVLAGGDPVGDLPVGGHEVDGEALPVIVGESDVAVVIGVPVGDGREFAVGGAGDVERVEVGVGAGIQRELGEVDHGVLGEAGFVGAAFVVPERGAGGAGGGDVVVHGVIFLSFRFGAVPRCGMPLW